MIIQNSMKLLSDISEIEQTISRIEKYIELNNIEVNIEGLLREAIANSER